MFQVKLLINNFISKHNELKSKCYHKIYI